MHLHISANLTIANRLVLKGLPVRFRNNQKLLPFHDKKPCNISRMHITIKRNYHFRPHYLILPGYPAIQPQYSRLTASFRISIRSSGHTA
jgi:hypothetical protein